MWLYPEYSHLKSFCEGRFVVAGELAEGVLLGTDTTTNRSVAIKVTQTDVDDTGVRRHQTRAALEINMYQAIVEQERRSGLRITPELLGVGIEQEVSYLINSLVGDSLECYYKAQTRANPHPEGSPTLPRKIKISWKLVRTLASQIIRGIELIHRTGHVFRGTHFGNFLLSSDNSEEAKHPEFGVWSKIYVIDFERACRWCDTDGNHIPFKVYPPQSSEVEYYGGREAFMGVNAHKKYSLSRRDDFEAVWYMLVDMLLGGLPWDGIKDGEKVLKMKLEVGEEGLCSGLEGEAVLLKMIHLVRQTKFEEEPDYDALCELFVH